MQDSASDYPVSKIRSLINEQTTYLPAISWSTNASVSGPITNFPKGGLAMATVFVNWDTRPLSLVNYRHPDRYPSFFSNLVQYFDFTSKSVSVTTVPPGLATTINYSSGGPPTNIGTYAKVVGHGK